MATYMSDRELRLRRRALQMEIEQLEREEQNDALEKEVSEFQRKRDQLINERRNAKQRIEIESAYGEDKQNVSSPATPKQDGNREDLNDHELWTTLDNYDISSTRVEKADDIDLSEHIHRLEKEIERMDNGNSQEKIDCNPKSTSVPLRIDLDEKERQIEIKLEDEDLYIKLLKEKEEKIDRELNQKKQEETLVQERIRNLESMTIELSRRQKRRTEIELRLQDKNNELDRYEKKLKDMRKREEDLRLLTIQSTEEKESFDRFYGKPHVPAFDGTSFEEWKLEVMCLKNSRLYPDHLITQAVRNSLKGPARKVLLTLNERVNTEDIVCKLQDLYGRNEAEDTDWQEFFTATQNKGESTSTWAIRLEALLHFAAKTNLLPEARKNMMLKKRFWKGLENAALRNATRVSFESNDTFEQLRSKVIKEEKDLLIEKDSEGSMGSRQSSDNEQLLLLRQLMSRMQKLELDLSEQKYRRPDNYRQSRGQWEREDRQEEFVAMQREKPRTFGGNRNWRRFRKFDDRRSNNWRQPRQTYDTNEGDDHQPRQTYDTNEGDDQRQNHQQQHQQQQHQQQQQQQNHQQHQQQNHQQQQQHHQQQSWAAFERKPTGAGDRLTLSLGLCTHNPMHTGKTI